jgi:hypothetical protein
MKMNNIIKHTNIPALSPVARDIYSASKKPMIKSFDDINVVVNSIHVSVNKVIADKGVRMEIDDINYLKKSISLDIIRDFSTLSLEDINVCFSMGVRGKLGDYYGINVATLYQWLDKYKNEVLPMANGEIYDKMPKAIEPVSEVDLKAFDISLLKKINQILDGEIELNTFNDFGNIHYNLLDKFQLINLSKDNKIDIFNRAKELYKSKLIHNNLDLLKQGKSVQVVSVENFMREIETNSKTARDIVIIEAKKIAFREYLQKIENKDEFIELLTNQIEEHYGNK